MRAPIGGCWCGDAGGGELEVGHVTGLVEDISFL